MFVFQNSLLVHNFLLKCVASENGPSVNQVCHPVRKSIFHCDTVNFFFVKAHTNLLHIHAR